MDLNEISVFIQVVRSGSFSLAARHLIMPISTVSFKVASLEKRLGITLIQRTTRKLNITPAGQAYFKRCLEGLATIASAEDEVASIQGEPNGLLRITAPVELGGLMAELVARFIATYPRVRVELILSERRVDLLSEGIDLAIRAGALQDSTLTAKKLGATWFGLYATPRYLKNRDPLNHPRDLLRNDCLQFTPIGTEAWKMTGPGGALLAPLPGKIIINDLGAIKNLCIHGGGIAFLPAFIVNQEVVSGKLVRVLPDWRSALSPIHFVYPGRKFVSPKLSKFMDVAIEALRASFDLEDR